MTRPNRSRSRLLLSCCGSALGLGLALAHPQRAAAQAFQATPTDVVGTTTRQITGTGTETVVVNTAVAIVDWAPQLDGSGNALTFLPNGNTATFTNNPQTNPGQTFAILNRILPDANSNAVRFDGTVFSRILGVDPLTGNQISNPGGFVAFYNPSGIVAGGTALFDVGSLMLTTLLPSDTSFANFATQGGTMQLAAGAGSTAEIVIAPGAQIRAGTQPDALPGSYFFAATSPRVTMQGSALVNGSHAYVAGEQVNLTFNNGLFDIAVPVGTAAGPASAGRVLELSGTIGGPSSTGAGDNHVIYGVMRAAQDPITMLVSGNIGFDTAASAGIVNGEVILSANFDVAGRSVNGGSISDGINAEFDANAATSATAADIQLRDFTSTSSLLAIGTRDVGAVADTAPINVTGNLLLAGRRLVSVGNNLSSTQNITVTGNVLAYASAFGSPTAINAQGGDASVAARFGTATVTITGNVRVAADAFGGNDGTASGVTTAGGAELFATAGTLDIGGNVRVNAEAIGEIMTGTVVGAPVNGGVAIVSSTAGGNITIGGSVDVVAGAAGTGASLVNPSTVSDTFAGIARISASSGGQVTVNGPAVVLATAVARGVNSAGPGAVGDGGQATVTADSATSSLTFNNDVAIAAFGFGGDNVDATSGTGGTGRGGIARASVNGGGTITVTGQFEAMSSGVGGAGRSGADGFGGVAGADAIVGTIDLQDLVSVSASGFGAAASFGFGGTGGDGIGGAAVLQARGTLTAPASLSVGNAMTTISLRAEGVGTTGGVSDGLTIAGGRGGDGFGGALATANQADPTYTNGAYLLAGGDNGTLTVNAAPDFFADGFGGNGGAGAGSLSGGNGGDGFGGHAEAGLVLFGGDGSVRQGRANFTSLAVVSVGRGGTGGLTGIVPTGNGGAGTGGTSLLSVQAGILTAGDVALSALGIGRGGGSGGAGTGGTVRLNGNVAGGRATLAELDLNATGTGGVGSTAIGGAGQGGTATVSVGGTELTVNGPAQLIVDGLAGVSGISNGFIATGNGANGTGGTALIDAFNSGGVSNVTITGDTLLRANGIATGATPGLTGGTGRGGSATVQARGGSSVVLQQAQILAGGLGGEATGAVGGEGIGGLAAVRTTGASSLVTIARAPAPTADQLAQGAMLGANGLGGATSGGSGIGGAGQGGRVEVTAANGFIGLPLTGSGPEPLILARGNGGTSSVDGGIGGLGRGGVGLFDANTSGGITIGTNLFSVLGIGGSSSDDAPSATINVAGGVGFGGTREIIVRSSAILNGEFSGGTVGGSGGNGSGTGAGGNGVGGVSSLIIENATFNAFGQTNVVGGGGVGGTGRTGGNGSGGGAIFAVTNGTINMASGQSAPQLRIGTQTIGGTGIDQGGNATGSLVSLDLDRLTLGGGTVIVSATAIGGGADSAIGQGGNAVSGDITGVSRFSALDLQTGIDPQLPGPVNSIRSLAQGGAGFTGGSATAGQIDLSIDGGSLRVFRNPDVAGTFDISASAEGGAGTDGSGGSATGGRVTLYLTGTDLEVDDGLTLAATAIGGESTGEDGGAAFGGVVNLLQGGANGNFPSGGFDPSDIRNDVAILANATGGTGINGGAASGGIARFQGQASVVVLDGSVSVAANATGGDAVPGRGGSGGNATGGLAQIRAGTAPDTVARITINGDATVTANALGGLGAVSDGSDFPGGRGGDGLGGAATQTNPVDSTFANGALLVAGGDSGSLAIGGVSLVSALGTGGDGGDGADFQGAGNGGNGSGGTADAGLVNQDGSLGQGTATFGLLTVITDGQGGSGGIAADMAQSGDGGAGTGGLSTLLGSTGDVIATTVNVAADGIGGAGLAGGAGTGGAGAGSITSNGGTITLDQFSAFAVGIGGTGTGDNGGDGRGGEAFMAFQGGTTTVNGSVIVDASGTGGLGDEGGAGGNGFGGLAELGINNPATGSATITGSAQVLAIGTGGGVISGLITGNGTGGTVLVQSQAGGKVRLGSLLAVASGAGGESDVDSPVIGGDGFGGRADLVSSGSGSQLIVEDYTPFDLADPINGDGATLVALGLGGATSGGTGIGGSGSGGIIGITASGGGSITLPTASLANRTDVGPIRIVADGIGGRSSVNAGQGGSAFGGFAVIEANGGSITMGSTFFSAIGAGGDGFSMGMPPAGVDGGDAEGGRRRIAVLDGGELTAQIALGSAGAFGGDGFGTGNGGNAVAGSTTVNVSGSTLTIVGDLGPTAVFSP